MTHSNNVHVSLMCQSQYRRSYVYYEFEDYITCVYGVMGNEPVRYKIIESQLMSNAAILLDDYYTISFQSFVNVDKVARIMQDDGCVAGRFVDFTINESGLRIKPIESFELYNINNKPSIAAVLSTAIDLGIDNLHNTGLYHILFDTDSDDSYYMGSSRSYNHGFIYNYLKVDNNHRLFDFNMKVRDAVCAYLGF